MTYDLWYWPGIQGRGEFVRLLMEAGGIDYRDRARETGADTLTEDMAARNDAGFGPYAPPYLVDGDFCIAQTAHIVSWLSAEHDLGSGDDELDMHLIQVQLTIADVVAEVHATHHPVDHGAFFEDQKDRATQNAKCFRDARIPKYFAHFEKSLGVVEGPFFAGQQWTHADTSLFQLVEGLRYAFPNRMHALKGEYPRIEACRDAVAQIDGITSYLASARRIAFNEDGIFRHYPELDGA